MRLGPTAALLLSLFPGIATASEPSAARVGEAIAARRDRVEELRLIREAAEELGARVWLFGGTAAGFAHYVRSDLAREAGDARYRQSFFDYDFTNIYRSTQDADLVVDATPEQAERLENLIREKMSFLQGSKEHWEVRLLRRDRVGRNGQVKQALLANPDFLEQHTDSNSTGMIELTEPPPGETVVRDLRDWVSPAPFFLHDVTLGRLHYYWSPTHHKTSRFLSGDNPPIFSVIRYLVKAFQYDLQVEGDDLKKVQAIIDTFDPAPEYAALSPWAKAWLERYGPNLFRHAVNIEYAWNTLEELGLREKLISLSDPSQEGTLGWWLSKEPLRTGPVGKGGGRTARELGISVVGHETHNFLAYESITRDTTGRPNVLISRARFPGESATLGPGFYSVRGRTGARGTGLTIRFEVDPEAREGSDFTVRDVFVVFLNRAALRVIPESMDLSIGEYFEMLGEGRLKADPADRGIWTKLQRRFKMKRRLPAAEEARVLAVVAQAIERLEAGGDLPPEPGPRPVLKAWLDLPLAEEHPELLGRLAPLYFRMLGDGHLTSTDDKQILAQLQERLVRSPRLSPRAESELLAIVSRALEPATPGAGGLLPLLEAWSRLPLSQKHPQLLQRLEERVLELVAQAIERFHAGEHLPPAPDPRPLLKAWLDLPLAEEHPEVLERLTLKCFQLLRDGHLAYREDQEILERLQERLGRSPSLSPDTEAALLEIVSAAVDRANLEGKGLSPLLQAWFGLPLSRKHPALVESLIDLKRFDARIAEEVLSQPGWSAHPELVQSLIDKDHYRLSIKVAQHLLVEEQWRAHPELMESLLANRRLHAGLLKEVFSEPAWVDQPDLIERLMELGGQDHVVASEILNRPYWGGHPEWVRAILQRADEPAMRQMARTLSMEHWRDHPELVLELIDRLPESSLGWDPLRGLFAQPQWQSHPEFVQHLIDRGGRFLSKVPEILTFPQWAPYPELVLAMIRRAGPGSALPHQLAQFILTRPHWRDHPVLRSMCGGSAPTVDCLERVVAEEPVDQASTLVGRLQSLAEPLGGQCR